jgi:hypothetical protein
MPISDAHKKANKKWNDANMKERYDRIQIVVKKGEREKIKAAAEQNGESVSGFIVRLIEAELERLSGERDNAGGGSGIPTPSDL